MGGRAGIPSSRSERPARLRRNTFFLKRKTGFSSPPRSCSWRRTDEIVFRPARKSTFSLHVVARKLPFSLRSPDQRYPFSSHRKVVSLRTSFILRNTSVWTKDGRGFSRRKYNHLPHATLSVWASISDCAVHMFLTKKPATRCSVAAPAPSVALRRPAAVEALPYCTAAALPCTKTASLTKNCTLLLYCTNSYNTCIPGLRPIRQSVNGVSKH
jgi:hypothetical protein